MLHWYDLDGSFDHDFSFFFSNQGDSKKATSPVRAGYLQIFLTADQ
jgi:hypothetical protein